MKSPTSAANDTVPVVPKVSVVPVVTAPTGTILEDEDDYFADVGFMFESQQPVRLEKFRWDIHTPSTVTVTNNATRSNTNDNKNYDSRNTHDDINQSTTTNGSSSSSIQIALHVADDNPGAVQSGHYLWPAATMLSEYIIHLYSRHSMLNDHDDATSYNNDNNNNNDSCNHNNICTVIELGAGCAMVSFVALQLWKETLQCLCITDHDPSTLVRARDNYETTVQLLLTGGNNHAVQDNTERDDTGTVVQDNAGCDNDAEDELLNDVINTVTNIPVLYESLPWGDTDAVEKLLHQTLPEHLSLDIFAPSSPARAAEHVSNATTNNIRHNRSNETSTTPQNHHQQQHHHYFDRILGSDLIYCSEVVRPLFTTAVQLMHPNPMTKSCFILAQSFVYDTLTEHEIDEICTEFQLQRTIVMDFPNETDYNDTTSTIASARSDHPTTNTTTVNGRIQEFRFINKMNEPFIL
jgi:Lysine methyltransferase